MTQDLSPIQFYKLQRGSYSKSNVELLSFGRQLVAIAESELREETTRLQIEQKNLLAQRREQKESEPWEDAPGVVLL